MSIRFYKSKLLIISSIIITPLYSYSEYKIEKLSPYRHIDFTFQNIMPDDLINNPNDEHRHGSIVRDNYKIFSSRYNSIIIISNEYNSKISYDAGKEFHHLNIKGLSIVNTLSLSKDGRYIIGDNNLERYYSPHYKITYFIYDNYLKKSKLLYDFNNYYFTTQDGRYSLFSKDDNNKTDDITQLNKKVFFIYDHIKENTIPLDDIDQSELNEHREKNRFSIYNNLTLPQNTILNFPRILGSTLDNRYFHGLSIRPHRDTRKKNTDLTDIKDIKVAFIYDNQDKKISLISNSELGSSRIKAISQNNIAVGWFEERKKFYHDERLFRRAYYYDIKKGTLSILNNISNWHQYNQSEATDISANGELIVGWVSDRYESNSPTTKRQAFVYQLNNNNAIFLASLQKDKGSSEAYSISQDGHAILGVSEDENNQWHIVAWYLDKESNKVEQEKEKVDNFLNTILAKKDIKLAQDHLKEVEKKRSVANTNYDQSLSTLNNQLQEVTKKLNDAIENKNRIEKIIDDGDSETWDKYRYQYERYEDDVKNYETQQADLQQKISALDNSPIGQERQVYRYEYQKNQQILTELQNDATVADDKATAEEDKPIVEDNATLEKVKPIVKDNATLEKVKPIVEDNAKAEEDKPIVKDNATVEKVKPIVEDNAKAEEDKPIVKDNAKAEEDKPIVKDNAKAEEDKPIADNNVQELPPQPTITVNTPIHVRNTEQAIQLAAENGYKFIDMQQGQLRYLASATCSVGMEKACLSGFTHYQNIDKANAIQTGISGAYRFDINQTPLVVGLAIDSDSYSSLPKGYEYQGYPLPLIGFSVSLIPSLNPTLNGNALHLSLKGAYLNRKITIERPTLSNTEAGKGQARISGYYIDFQGYYPYTLNSLITVTPFAGLTFNQTSRSAYSETQGAKFAAHYQALTAHSLLAKIGSGIEYVANAKLKLDTKAGLLWHLSHHQDDFQSHIDYIGQQKINYNENKKQLAQRPFASVGLTYQLDKQSSVNTTTNWQMTSYRNHDIHMGIAYTYRF
ncbi:autotransporter domain-containing protein [Proteus mirabilis]|nr:autotransporter domain-containing protein [Proteus mirabilis]WFC28042.1 autotransporter domain-containing protein [Proteus mirabilis]